MSERIRRDQEGWGKKVNRTQALDLAEAFVPPPPLLDLETYELPRPCRDDLVHRELDDDEYDEIEAYAKEALEMTERLERERSEKSLPLGPEDNPCKRPIGEWDLSGASIERYLRRSGRASSYDQDPNLIAVIHWRNQGPLMDDISIWCEFEHRGALSGIAKCWVPLLLLLPNRKYSELLTRTGFSISAAMDAVRANTYLERPSWEDFFRTHIEEAQIQDDEEPLMAVLKQPPSATPNGPQGQGQKAVSVDETSSSETSTLSSSSSSDGTTPAPSDGTHDLPSDPRLVVLPRLSEAEVDRVVEDRTSALWKEWLAGLVARNIDMRALSN